MVSPSHTNRFIPHKIDASSVNGHRSKMNFLSVYFSGFSVVFINTVNSPNSGHFGMTAFVLYLESVLYWGVL